MAIRGLAADGNRFVDAARKKGAVAVCSEEPPRGEGTWLRVPDAREALAVFSAAVLGDPARSLELVGITGTNGKTTTAYLVDSAVRAAGEKCGLLGTVEYRVGDRVAEASRTTPESSDLQGFFRQMVDAGCRRAVLEVSSHSLALKRVHGLEFQVAVFTNLTRDHLDFHGDVDAYFLAKRILFESLLRKDGRAIVNLDDDHAAEVVKASRGARLDLLGREAERRPLRRGRADVARRRALPRADPRGRARDRDAARRPLQRAQHPRRSRRRARARTRARDGAPRDRRLERGARSRGARPGRPGFHGAGRLRAHGRRSQEPARDRARPEARPPDHRLRLRRRPRPHQASADGGGGVAALGRADPDLRQPAQRAARGHPRRRSSAASRPRAPATRS